VKEGKMDVYRLDTNPLHLGLGAKALVEPVFDGDMGWYAAYGARHDAADGAEGRLVTIHTFTESWDSWEMHPVGDEVVLCLAGSMTLQREHADGRTDAVTIGEGEYAINPPGCWHTADIADRATALFITAGMGTEARPR
jgi:mannose-6-phosphate isomerase-like protein (cupin superfamily)